MVAGGDAWRYVREPAVLATMHGKERVIAPLLAPLGLEVSLVPGIDTDRHGSFSRTVARSGTALEAARAKIADAFRLAPAVRVGLASEGSFGPHPAVPLLPYAQELVLLIDRERGLQVAGHDVGTDTNYAQACCTEVATALAFARRTGFPAHGVIAMACESGRPVPHRALFNDLESEAALANAVRWLLMRAPEAFVETDMRAHRNPTRMAAIARAAANLVRSLASRCPVCARPGFDVGERLPGLPCAACLHPTRQLRAERLRCVGCGHAELRPVADGYADPAGCEFCNP